MSGLLPSFQWVANDRNAGSTYDPTGIGYPWRILLHTMEGYLSNASVPMYHQYPPHLWYAPARRKGYQTVPLDRGAYALYQGNGAEWTNRARCLQVELEGFAGEAWAWPDQYLWNIAQDVIVPIALWVRAQGSRVDLGNVPPIGAIGGSANEYAAQRLPPLAWRGFDGVLSHRHAPYNDHWDTGGLLVDRICAMAAQLLAGPAAPSPSTTGALEVYEFNERAGEPFLWPGFAHACLAYDCGVVRKGDTIVATLVRPGRERNVKLLPPSGRDEGMARLVRWGAPGAWAAEEDGFHTLIVEADEGRGVIRGQGRKG